MEFFFRDVAETRLVIYRHWIEIRACSHDVIAHYVKLQIVTIII